MSLFDKNTGKKPTNITVTHLIRNKSTESFGESIMNDFATMVGPISGFTNSIYRNKALKAIEKRNAILGNESEYINTLANANIGDNFSAIGNISESNFFDYICKYCEMEIMVHKRNSMLGNTSPAIEEKLKNPPAPSQLHMKKIAYCTSIMAICQKDMAKAKFFK